MSGTECAACQRPFLCHASFPCRDAAAISLHPRTTLAAQSHLALSSFKTPYSRGKCVSDRVAIAGLAVQLPWPRLAGTNCRAGRLAIRYPVAAGGRAGAKRSEQGNVPYGVRPRWTGRAREVSCQQTTLSGRFLAALRDLYSAFAHDSQTGELPDHVATAPISTATCG